LTRLSWDSIGDRLYEKGVDRGVLYAADFDGVAWNGLSSVTEKPSGGSSESYYIDGEKFTQSSTPEDFAATISALTYPEEFDACDGIEQYNSGMFLTGQPRKPFGFTYRTLIGNDVAADAGYKIHVVYNAVVSPTDRDNKTVSDTVNPIAFSWDVETVPVQVPGFRSSAHIVLDSRTIRGLALSAIEDILYGSGSDAPRLPTISEISLAIDAYADLLVTDYGDGTATISGTGVTMIDANTYTTSWPSVVELDVNTYSVTSS
jgi:hypothetical protein